jgi:hypothetical protein
MHYEVLKYYLWNDITRKALSSIIVSIVLMDNHMLLLNNLVLHHLLIILSNVLPVDKHFSSYCFQVVQIFSLVFFCSQLNIAFTKQC